MNLVKVASITALLLLSSTNAVSAANGQLSSTKTSVATQVDFVPPVEDGEPERTAGGASRGSEVDEIKDRLGIGEKSDNGEVREGLPTGRRGQPQGTRADAPDCSRNRCGGASRATEIDKIMNDLVGEKRESNEEVREGLPTGRVGQKR